MEFTALQLTAPLAKAIDVLGFTRLTPVQEHALPHLLANKDVIAQARTGSGKTVAFGLALLTRVDVALPGTQALVLCPTRELADQVSEEIRRLARFIPNLRVATLCGGVPVRTQTPALLNPPHVVVGTPGRILDHLRRETLSFDGLRVLVLDEADRMLDMGFKDDIEAAVAQTPRDRQTLLFSATYPQPIRALSASLQRHAVDITVDTAPEASDVEELAYAVPPADRLAALVALLKHHAPETALVFCHTRNDVRDVTEHLGQRGFVALALHGELEQWERDEVLVRFSNKSTAVLVATDVAARGLDIKELAAVVSYELPNDTDTHVHRRGRTGRAGAKGLSVVMVAPSERNRSTAIERAVGAPFSWATLPADSGKAPAPPPMVTLEVSGGKQDKLRKGDLLGALTGDVGLAGEVVGKIDVAARRTYVAIRRDQAAAALSGLASKKIKGRSFKVRRLG